MVSSSEPVEAGIVMPFLWLGNHAATDLCNTTPIVDGVTLDLIPDVEAVERWAREARISDAAMRPAEHTAATVHALRAAMRAALEAAELTPDLVAAVNEALAVARSVVAIDPDHDDDPVVHLAHPASDQLIVDIATAVTDIFRHGRDRIRRCADPHCVLLFLDTSKSGRRRWCDMATCGNRAKAASHYARQHP